MVMLLTSPMPLAAAVSRLEAKTPVASKLTSAQWSEVAVGLRERAFFSARVDELRTIVSMQSKLQDAIGLVRRDGAAFLEKANFIAQLRRELGATPGDTGLLTDITSAKRLGLIYDFNTEDAVEYGRWLARQDPVLLALFPCSELVRIESRVVPRGYRRGPGGKLIAVPEESWPARWEAAGGIFYDGRMIAPKDSPIWIAISRFGRPWPPFDFMSGMGLADVTRAECIRLGVISADTPPPAPQQLPFNHNLQASVPEASPAILEAFQKIFGATATVSADGRIAWRGDLSRLPSPEEQAAALRSLGEPSS